MSTIALSSNARSVLSGLDAFPRAMLLGIAAALDRENEITVGSIQREKLSRRGPTTLGVRTNRLRSSVRPAKAVVSADGVVSAIGSNVVYAGIHEYGFTGAVQVKAHTRKRALDALGAAVVAVFDPRTGAIKRGQANPTGPIAVAAHARQLKVPARRYIGSTIDARADAYSRALSAAVLAAWQSPGNPVAP